MCQSWLQASSLGSASRPPNRLDVVVSMALTWVIADERCHQRPRVHPPRKEPAEHQQTGSVADSTTLAIHCACIEIRDIFSNIKRGHENEPVGSGLVFTYRLGVSPGAVAARLALVALHSHVSVLLDSATVVRVGSWKISPGIRRRLFPRKGCVRTLCFRLLHSPHDVGVLSGR